MKKRKAPAPTPAPAPGTAPRSPWHLIARLAVIILVVIASVVFTDRKGYFLSDQANPHHEHRWEAFYNFTEHDTVDVLVLGTSHAFCGINPKNLSACLGCNCMVMAFNATTIADSYYVLRETLTRTTPSLVVVETYGMQGLDNHHLSGSALSNQYRSFYPRRNLALKLASLHDLFAPENYLPAFSSTLRNHTMLLSSPDEVAFNSHVQSTKHLDPNRLYLGRFVRFTSGISDSLMHIYDSCGAPLDGACQYVSPQDIAFASRIVDLCQQKGIAVMFTTVPVYYRHVTHYPDWKRHLAEAIAPTNTPWFDLQENMDTTLFNRDCFENTTDENQHMTYTGSIIYTYLLAHYIADSLKVPLPYRAGSHRWQAMFDGHEGFYENYNPAVSSDSAIVFMRDTMVGSVHVVGCLQTPKDMLYLKVDKATPCPDTLIVFVEGSVLDETIMGGIPVVRNHAYRPLHHDLYSMHLKPAARVRRVVGLSEAPRGGSPQD